MTFTLGVIAGSVGVLVALLAILVWALYREDPR